MNIVELMEKCANPDCGKEFIKSRHDQKYCCKACRKHAVYLRSKEGKERDEKVLILCGNPDCGKIFEAKTRKSKYCCKSCSIHARYLINRSVYKEQRFCPVCGTELSPDAGSSAKYCGKECRLIALGRLKKRRVKGRGAKPKLSLAEANELARSEGLTYGQYYNRHGYGDWFE